MWETVRDAMSLPFLPLAKVCALLHVLPCPHAVREVRPVTWECSAKVLTNRKERR